MNEAKAGDTVRIHYAGKLEDGTPFDSSEGRDPLEFSLGGGEVIPGVDKAVEGMEVGENKSVTIQPEEAYGQRREQLVQEIPKSALPEDMDPAVGMQLQAENPDGQTMRLTVAAVAEDSITVDGNHPLAGKALRFEIELVEIA